MLHIYRQVTGLKRVRTFVMTKQRENADDYPFGDIEVLPRARIHFLVRFWSKYARRMEPVFYRGEYDQLAGVLAHREADALHVYFGHTGVHLLPFLRNWPKPSVVSFHGMDIMQRDAEPGYNAALRELLRMLPMVFARSESLAARLAELGCDPAKIRINRTGIPMDAFPAKIREVPPDRAWRFVQASRFIEKKGLHDTLSAFALFRQSAPASRLVLAGEGPMQGQLEQAAHDLGLREAVDFPGFLSGADLAALFLRSHVFVHPSVTTPRGDQEGVPNSMLEAMATGLPVAATRHGGIPEAVSHGIDGHLVSERSPEDLARALVDITANLPTLSQCAASNVREKFEQSRSIRKLEDFYFELLSK